MKKANCVKMVVEFTCGIILMASSFMMGAKVNQDHINIGKNVNLEIGKVTDVILSHSDKYENYMYFDVKGHEYVVHGFNIAEDMDVDDDILVCIDTKDTISRKDDVIMMWKYYRPDLH